MDAPPFLSLLRSRKVQVGGLVTVFLLVLASLFVFGRTVYSLDASVKRASQMLPAGALWALELPDPSTFKKSFFSTKTGQKLSSSPSFRNLLSLPEFQGVGLLNYLIGVGTGQSGGLQDLLDLSGGSTGLAAYTDGSHLLVMKTGLTSRYGAALVRMLSGKAREIVPETTKPEVPFANRPVNPAESASNSGENPDDTTEVVTEENYLPAITEKRIHPGGVPVSEFVIQGRKVYLTLLGDFLFLSDSLDTLERSLFLAGHPGSGSLADREGMEQVSVALEQNRDSLAFYPGGRSLPALPLLQLMTSERNEIAFVISPSWTDRLADVYELGEKRVHSSAKAKGASSDLLTSGLPARAALVFYSRDFRFVNFLQSLEERPGGSGFSDRIRAFLRVTGLSAGTLDSGAPGLGVSFFGFRENPRGLYPSFSVVAPTSCEKSGLLPAIFRTGDSKQEKRDGRITFHYTVPGGGFSPACMDTAEHGSFSTDKEAERWSEAAWKGSAPVFQDYQDERKLGIYAQAPIHIIIPFDLARKALLELLYYDAKKSPYHSKTTVDRDFLSLVDLFSDVRRVHLATGRTAEGDRPVGRLVVYSDMDR